MSSASGVNVNQAWANYIIGTDSGSGVYYGLNLQTGKLQFTASAFSTVFSSCSSSLPSGTGVIVDLTTNSGFSPSILRYVSSSQYSGSGLSVNITSSEFSIATTGTYFITSSHSLPTTPKVQDVGLQVIVSSASTVSDWGYGLLRVDSVSSASIYSRIAITSASSLGTATARLGIKVNVY